MKKYLLLLICASSALYSVAQESNNGKKLWAKSVLNEKAPEIIVHDWVSDKPDTKGKFVIVDFWATWCGPCVKVIPELNALQEKFKDNLVVIGLSDEPVEKIKKFDKAKIEYFNGVDTSKTVSKLLEVKGIPHMILIDPNGIVRWEGFPSLPDHKFTEEVLVDLMKKYPAVKKEQKVIKATRMN